ncbi:MAG: hypothetical protein ACKVJE_17630 [Pseudomonadales bacterium]
MIRENLIALIDGIGSSEKKRFSEFAEMTGIKSPTIKQFYHGNQKLNNEQLDLINKAFPQYVYWLATGDTIPESGQISPELEKITTEYLKTGTDTE